MSNWCFLQSSIIQLVTINSPHAIFPHLFFLLCCIIIVAVYLHDGPSFQRTPSSNTISFIKYLNRIRCFSYHLIFCLSFLKSSFLFWNKNNEKMYRKLWFLFLFTFVKYCPNNLNVTAFSFVHINWEVWNNVNNSDVA